jgi:hypothetical protein
MVMKKKEGYGVWHLWECIWVLMNIPSTTNIHGKTRKINIIGKKKDAIVASGR